MEAKTIAVVTQKGGVGKSTTCIELSAVLAIEHDKKVLLVDFDGQANASMYLGVSINEGKSSYDILQDPELIKKAIVNLEHFDVIPASPALSRVATEHAGSTSAVFNLDDALSIVKDDYDYIIIDCGPQRDMQIQMVYVAADYIVSPTTADNGGVQGILNVFEDLEDLRSAKIPLTQAKMICTLMTEYKNENVHNAVLQVLTKKMKELSDEIIVYPIPNLKEAGVAKLKQKAIEEFAPYSGIALAYKDVVNEMLMVMEA